MYDYANTSEERGISVIISRAGGSAHLPGMVASLTYIPGISVTIKLKNLWGIDSLLSIVQMPACIPVATVSINGGNAAGLLAAKMLGVESELTRQRSACYVKKLETEGETDFSLNEITSLWRRAGFEKKKFSARIVE